MFKINKVGERKINMNAPQPNKSIGIGLVMIFAFMLALAMIIWADNAISDESVLYNENRQKNNLKFGDMLTQEIATLNAWNFHPVLVGNYSDQQRAYIDMAWSVSGGDMEFLYMLKSENGTFDPHRQSLYRDALGQQEPSYGFCQIHAPSHPEIIQDPRFWDNANWQMSKCYELWINGVVFYGYERLKYNNEYRQKIKSHFELRV